MTDAPPKDQLRRIPDDAREQLRAKWADLPHEPLLPAGATGACPICDGDDTLVTTNNLSKTIPEPGGVRVITRLPGAQCTECGAKTFDAAALAIIEENKGHPIVADYDTRVSRSGKLPAVLVKEDLRRVLGLEPGHHLRWTVLDRDHALVEVRRAPDQD